MTSRGMRPLFLELTIAGDKAKIIEAWEINCAKDPLNRDDGALLPKEYLHLTIAEKKK